VIALGIFALFQVINGITNILTARYMKKRAQLEAQIREDEARLMSEQWDSVIIKFSDVMEKVVLIEEQLIVMDGNIKELADDVFDVILQSARDSSVKNARGPYGPRKKKTIEHKVKNDG
jgi:hypothetical protein